MRHTRWPLLLLMLALPVPGAIAQSDEEPAQSDEEPAQSDEEPAQSDEEPAQSAEEPAQSDEEPAQSAEEPAPAEEPSDFDPVYEPVETISFQRTAHARVNPCTAPAARAAPSGPARFKALHCAVTNPRYEEEQAAIRKEGVLEAIAADLNNLFTIPKDVTLTYEECRQPNAFYHPPSRSVVMCFELVDAYYKTFGEDGLEGDELDESVQNAITFAFYHELGHALIQVLDLPITGKQEDAADQLATWMVADGSDANERTALDGAVGFYLQAQKKADAVEENAFRDEHSLDEQRFFNIVCWLYGDSPEKYQDLVKDGTLPKERAVRCVDEWKRVDSAWSKLLAPSLK